MSDRIASVSMRRDIVVIGTSAGGVEALRELFSKIDPAAEAAYFVVLHVPAGSTSLLPQLLARVTTLKVQHAEHGMPIEYGQVYVAPPDYHLHVARGRVVLSRGPRENRSRPAIDALFRTAAEVYSSRVIGVLLTGTLDDGTAGMLEIHRHGGLTVVQNPATAVYEQMPRNAIERVPIDRILDLEEIAPMLNQELTDHRESENDQIGKHAMNTEDQLDLDRELVQQDINEQEGGEHRRRISTYSCPDCGGVLWETDPAGNGQSSGVIKFRCHVGHTYAAESLYSAQEDSIEVALWSAVRALTEKGILSRQLAKRMKERGVESSAQHFELRALEAEASIAVLRKLITGSSDAEVVGSAEP